MTFTTIAKSQRDWTLAPNLLHYERERGAFSWENARRELEGLPHGRGLNIAHEAVDRHSTGPRRGHLALRWLGKSGEVCDYTYGDLRSHTNRFANVLKALDVAKGDRVYVLAGRIPELYIAALGTLKNPGDLDDTHGLGKRSNHNRRSRRYDSAVDFDEHGRGGHFYHKDVVGHDYQIGGSAGQSERQMGSRRPGPDYPRGSDIVNVGFPNAGAPI